MIMMMMLVFSGGLSKPSSLYLGTADMQQLMGNKVLYMEVSTLISAADGSASSELTGNSEEAVRLMAKDLGVVTSVDAACILTALREWSMTSSDHRCSLTRAQAINMYSRLGRLMLSDQQGDMNSQVSYSMNPRCR
jgi:hypothetical protein